MNNETNNEQQLWNNEWTTMNETNNEQQLCIFSEICTMHIKGMPSQCSDSEIIKNSRTHRLHRRRTKLAAASFFTHSYFVFCNIQILHRICICIVLICVVLVSCIVVILHFLSFTHSYFMHSFLSYCEHSVLWGTLSIPLGDASLD